MGFLFYSKCLFGESVKWPSHCLRAINLWSSPNGPRGVFKLLLMKYTYIGLHDVTLWGSPKWFLHCPRIIDLWSPRNWSSHHLDVAPWSPPNKIFMFWICAAESIETFSHHLHTVASWCASLDEISKSCSINHLDVITSWLAPLKLSLCYIQWDIFTVFLWYYLVVCIINKIIRSCVVDYL